MTARFPVSTTEQGSESVPSNRPLTVLLATMAPFVSGAEIAGERLALGLADRGHRVVVVVGTDGDALRRYHAAGLEAVYSPMCHTSKWGWWRYWLARQKLRRLIHKVQPDVVHSNDLQTHQIVSDAARAFRIPRVCHHRFLFPGAALDWLNKYGSEVHIAISRAVRVELCGSSEQLSLGRWETVYDGIPIPAPLSPIDRAAARLRLGLAADSELVLFTGQVIECKGVADLLKAWSLLPPHQRSKSTLAVVGEDKQTGGRYRVAMQRLAADLGINVAFPGFVKDVALWQSAASVAVVPSHIEPLGLVALEAMAREVPVIGTDVGGLPEIIVQDETGLLVPPHDPTSLASALTRLLEDHDQRRRYGAAGRQRCQRRFGIDAHVQNILAAYLHTLTPQTHFSA